jgi:4-amino-4-deoxy-L-arabinose transferase-like glycosyltransferase
MRLASVLCGLLAIWLIYRTLRIAYPERPLLAVLAAGIAALTPTHIAITSTVNNDALLEVCFSGTLFALLSSFKGGLTTSRAIWLGIGIGAAILTKATGLLLLPISLLSLFLFRKSGESRQTLWRGALLAYGTVLVLCGWWFVRNGILYGEILPLRAFSSEFAGTLQAGVLAARLGGWGSYFLLMGQGIFQSFWAVYGRQEDLAVGNPRFLPDQIYLILAVVCIMSVAGLLRMHFRRKAEFTETQIYAIWILFTTLGLVAASFVAFILKYVQMQGRYLYPAMLPICVLLSLGWLAVFPPRYQKTATGLLLALLAVFCIVFLREL